MRIDKDYIVTSTDVRYRDLDVVATIKIIDGDYKDTEFHYGSINVAEEENPDGTLTLSFEYDIISEEHKHLRGVDAFEATLGKIMNDLLTVSLNEAEKRYKDELRAENTKTSDFR